MLSTYHSPHGDKLKALLINKQLEKGDESRIRAAIEKYMLWKESMAAPEIEANNYIATIVESVNAYKTYIDLNLIYDSENNFLYRQNGQIKLANSVIEEFLPYLFDERLVPGIARLGDFSCGPSTSYAGLSFESPYIALCEGGVYLKSKNQDFAVGKRHRLSVSNLNDPCEKPFSRDLCVAHFAVEIKTNLDKTMFQEASQTAQELKRVVPGARYILLCEYLDMAPIASKLSSIDEVIILRRAKRLSSTLRAGFSTASGRQQYRSEYEQFLTRYPLNVQAFERLVEHLNACFPAHSVHGVDEVLRRGYF